MKCWKFHETDLGQKVENDPYIIYESDSPAPSTCVDGDEDLRLAVSPDKAVELQTGEIAVEISVDDLCLIIRDNIRPWNWGVNILACYHII